MKTLATGKNAQELFALIIELELNYDGVTRQSPQVTTVINPDGVTILSAITDNYKVWSVMVADQICADMDLPVWASYK